jgi:hypothetical protein
MSNFNENFSQNLLQVFQRTKNVDHDRSLEPNSERVEMVGVHGQWLRDVSEVGGEWIALHGEWL